VLTQRRCHSLTLVLSQDTPAMTLALAHRGHALLCDTHSGWLMSFSFSASERLSTRVLSISACPARAARCRAVLQKWMSIEGHCVDSFRRAPFWVYMQTKLDVHGVPESSMLFVSVPGENMNLLPSATGGIRSNAPSVALCSCHVYAKVKELRAMNRRSE
jgi:hypothetical protein